MFLSSTVTLQHFGWSYDFMSETSVSSFMAGVKNATSHSTNSSHPIKITLDHCGFHEKASTAFLGYMQDPSITAHFGLIQTEFEVEYRGYYTNYSNMDTLSKLVRSSACVRELAVPHEISGENDGATVYVERILDRLFKRMYEAATCGTLRLELLDFEYNQSEVAAQYIVQCLPHLLKLRTLHPSRDFLETNRDQLVQAFRANGSLYHVRMSKCSPRFKTRIEAFCQRNQQLPRLLVQPIGGSKNDDDDDVDDVVVGTHVAMLPLLFRSAGHMPRMGSNIILIGLLSASNFSTTHVSCARPTKRRR